MARLIAHHAELTDQQVVIRLREEDDCASARRIVAYDRGKRLRRNKRRIAALQSSRESGAT
ncbi:MAG TPA: hypothetical protein VNA16_08260 [Abditibacteriaceae bacterium]|nr:hypothetical protein [Abditibacteriaceae bacterium]